MVATATSAETGNFAVEFTTGTLDAVLYSSRLQGIDEPSWACVSKTLRSPTSEDEALNLSFFTGINKTIPANEPSWFCAEKPLPETDISIDGAEMIFRKGIVGGSVTGLMNIGRFRKPAPSFRTECYVDYSPCLVSAGYFYSDGHYTSLEGKTGTVRSRFFFAPLFYAKPSFLAFSRISWGALVYADSSADPDFTKKNNMTLNGGTGVKIDSSVIGFTAQGMVAEDEIIPECSIQFKNLVPKKLRGSISGKAMIGRVYETSIRAKSEEILSSATFTPVSFLQIEAKHSITVKNDTRSTVNKGNLGLATAFSIKKTECEASLDTSAEFEKKRISLTLSALLTLQ